MNYLTAFGVNIYYVPSLGYIIEFTSLWIIILCAFSLTLPASDGTYLVNASENSDGSQSTQESCQSSVDELGKTKSDVKKKNHLFMFDCRMAM